MLEHTLRRDNMSSSDNDGLPSVDSELIHSQDLLRSSDFERSSESAHIDDNSEEIASMHLTKNFVCRVQSAPAPRRLQPRNVVLG